MEDFIGAVVNLRKRYMFLLSCIVEKKLLVNVKGESLEEDLKKVVFRFYLCCVNCVVVLRRGCCSKKDVVCCL